ncbi:MAG: helix-turn-helix domain-containing protein [Oscillospiraceae bacterium]|nr:helix-turn-helix domain-containing protein [Oscillospiraceae bacterium]
MTIGDRIKQRRLEIGLSVDQLAEKIGKNRATVYRYESKEIEKFPIDILSPLAEALHTTPAYLMGWEDSSNGTLPDNIIPMPETRKIPLVGSIACGKPILAEENIEEYVSIPKELGGDFALTCRGDSMINARIYDGDIVYIRQQDTVENGEIAAVLIDTDATLKRVRILPDRIILEPENPMYDPLVYRGEDMNTVRILGKAVAFTSAVR